MRKFINIVLMLITLAIFAMFFSCESRTSAWRVLDTAEQIMEIHPDSALSLLSEIEKETLGGNEECARYALLMSMALDKNYIDATSFDVLQPAIDYYEKNGSPDDKLRTLYYQGRIYQNMANFDMAMQTFLKANDCKNECRDTLTYANMLVAQSILNYASYQLEDYVSNNMMAADLYDDLNNDRYRQSSLIKALDGSIVLGNRQLSDSILTIVDSLVESVHESQEEILLV